MSHSVRLSHPHPLFLIHKVSDVNASGGNSGGSRGGSQGAMDPPFQAEHCMQKQDSQQLTEVQQSLPASTPVLSVLYSLATNNH